MENLLTNVPKEKRYAALREMAKKVQSEPVRRHYSEDEKAQIKDHVAQESISLMDKEDEFKEISKQFREGIKETKKELRDALQRIKKGFSEETEDVFLMDDQQAGLMHAYDRDGKFLYSRALFPDERQTTIIDLSERKAS